MQTRAEAGLTVPQLAQVPASMAATVSGDRRVRHRVGLGAQPRVCLRGGPLPARAVTVRAVGAALGWTALAASSLVIGELLGVARRWPERAIGLVLAFGAGALISAVSFDLAEEGVAIGGAGSVAIGLVAGGLTYYGLDRLLERGPGRTPGGGGGTALALGALLDGIPEQMVLGIGIAAGDGVSAGLLVAIFVSNLPEAIGASSDMRAAGQPTATVRRVWWTIAAVCTVAGAVGYAVADATSGDLRAGINGFAAGALLVMLVDSMIPEASAKAGRPAGLVTVLGFALAAGLTGLSS
jgi:ZIP family zinc transporter